MSPVSSHLQADKIYESDKTLGILFRSIQEPVLDHVQDADFGDARFRASQFEVDESYVKEAAKMARAVSPFLPRPVVLSRKVAED